MSSAPPRPGSPTSSPLAAAWAGVWEGWRRAPPLQLPPGQRLDGLRVAVTGASRGLGLAIAEDAASRGAAVLAGCRTGHREVADRLKSFGAEAEVVQLDLEDWAGVRAFAGAVRAFSADRLVLNAGVVTAGARAARSGLDLMVQVNFLANTAIVDALGLTAPGNGLPAGFRLVVVGSESHRTAPPLREEPLVVPAAYGTGDAVAWYGYSKLLLHTWTVELARRVEGVHHLCPGAIASDIAREAPPWVRPVLGVAMRLFFQRPADAARPVLWLLGASDVGAPSGVYLKVGVPGEVSAAASDRAAGLRVWDAATEARARWQAAG